MQSDQYIGIEHVCMSEYKASGSKFLGFLFPCTDAVYFDQKIKTYKEQYKDATHVCSACVLGVEREYQRCSDDGEPSNSSGRPILNALLSAGVTFVGCAVVRFYGGKKLGIPGLIEAYGATTQYCINIAELKSLVIMSSITCTIPNDISYQLYNYLSKRGDLNYELTPSGKFILTCGKNLTPTLRKDLEKIPNLVVE